MLSTVWLDYKQTLRQKHAPTPQTQSDAEYDDVYLRHLRLTTAALSPELPLHAAVPQRQHRHMHRAGHTASVAAPRAPFDVKASRLPSKLLEAGTVPPLNKPPSSSSSTPPPSCVRDELMTRQPVRRLERTQRSSFSAPMRTDPGAGLLLWGQAAQAVRQAVEVCRGVDVHVAQCLEVCWAALEHGVFGEHHSSELRSADGIRAACGLSDSRVHTTASATTTSPMGSGLMQSAAIYPLGVATGRLLSRQLVAPAAAVQTAAGLGGTGPAEPAEPEEPVALLLPLEIDTVTVPRVLVHNLNEAVVDVAAVVGDSVGPASAGAGIVRVPSQPSAAEHSHSDSDSESETGEIADELEPQVPVFHLLQAHTNWGAPQSGSMQWAAVADVQTSGQCSGESLEAITADNAHEQCHASATATAPNSEAPLHYWGVWDMRVDPTYNAVYFYNTATGESSWQAPTGWPESLW